MTDSIVRKRAPWRRYVTEPVPNGIGKFYVRDRVEDVVLPLTVGDIDEVNQRAAMLEMEHMAEVNNNGRNR